MTSAAAGAEMIAASSVDELKTKGMLVVRGADRPIVVVYDEGSIRAVDNRCPHLGFPLHRGSVKDGILTCHWHEARFDLCSGCTFDLWADDVPAFDVEVRDGIVYVAATPRRATTVDGCLHRLEIGMQQGIGLIQAKSLIGLISRDTELADIVRPIALFGVGNRDAWAPGLTVLAAMANLAPALDRETAYMALLQGSQRVAADCAGQSPHRPRQPLDGATLSLPTLKRWLRYWTLVRHRDGAERTLLTAIAQGASPNDMADLVFSAATERFYADGGHLVDFANKAFELLDLIGWEHAPQILPALVSQLVSASGGEESNSWRHPVDLVPLLRDVEQQLPQCLQRGHDLNWDDQTGLVDVILGDEPVGIIDGIREAICAGARPQQLTKVLAYAAVLRIVRFGTANELTDWVTALHTFTYCNALDRAVGRCPSVELVRGIFHGAMSVYLDRFLNVPPAKLPRDDEDLSREPDELRRQFLELLDGRHQVIAASTVVARYLRLGHPVEPLVDTFAAAVAREDIDFHAIQMLEAAVAQYPHWQGSPRCEHLLIAVARYLAAHCPTQRRLLQTANIALRLHRGDKIYEEDDDGSGS